MQMIRIRQFPLLPMHFETARKLLRALPVVLLVFAYQAAQASQFTIAPKLPETVLNVWNKTPLEGEIVNNSVRIFDPTKGKFNDASQWQLNFNQTLPEGKKTLAFNMDVGVNHIPLWGDALFQPLVNGEKVTPGIDADGKKSYEPLVAQDGRQFVPAKTRLVTLNLPKNAFTFADFSMVFAGAQSMDVSLRNFKINSDAPAVQKIAFSAPNLFVPQIDVSKRSAVTNLRDEAWSAFYWFTDGKAGPYRRAKAPDLRAKLYDNSSKTIDVSDGWFDAGDYGKYSVNTAHSVGLIMLTGLIAPDALNHNFQMGNKSTQQDWKSMALVPLNWLLKMQRRDGAVHHKVAAKKFPPMSLKPRNEKKNKWVMPVSSTATAQFAGVMALAAKIYGNIPFVGDRFRLASSRAQQWLARNGGLHMAKAKYGFSNYGGPYTDRDDGDERLFAAAAGLLIGQDGINAVSVEAMLKRRSSTMKRKPKPMDWQNTDLVALWTLKLAENKLSRSGRALVNGLLKSAAQRSLQNMQNSALQVAHANIQKLPWGSNGVLAGTGWHWLLWAKKANEPQYANAALDQLNWFVGRNPSKQIFITGKAAGRAKAPHFRPWSSKAIALPNGLLVGGPNSGNVAGDKILRRLKHKPAWLRYADHVDSYASNEVAINWQAAWATYLSLAAGAMR